jgi:hypothetical protein
MPTQVETRPGFLSTLDEVTTHHIGGTRHPPHSTFSELLFHLQVYLVKRRLSGTINSRSLRDERRCRHPYACAGASSEVTIECTHQEAKPSHNLFGDTAEQNDSWQYCSRLVTIPPCADCLLQALVLPLKVTSLHINQQPPTGNGEAVTG